MHSDSDSDSDGAWEGRLGDQYNPPVDLNPDTCEVDRSEIKTQIRLATGAAGSKVTKSFAGLLRQREQGRCLSSSFSHGECSDIRSHPDERRFCVFSLTTSSDGREILGGANDGCLYVFDREQNKRTLKIDSHEDDVNAVSFADASSQILFSGGDDALCKGDARYLISNSKDQTIKLWDIRKFSPKEGLAASRLAVTQQNWDYRWQQVPKRGAGREERRGEGGREERLGVLLAASTQERCGERGEERRGVEGGETGSTAGSKYPREVRGERRGEERGGGRRDWEYCWQQVPKRALKRHRLPGDTSLMSYRGHGVLHTLIRCRFSPEFSTGQRYIYTGCSTGRVVVYDVLTGGIVTKLCNHDACVRDVSWHPYQESIVSSSVSERGDTERVCERERERERERETDRERERVSVFERERVCA
ncbi:DDB1- and CUL4-associated factor 11 [Acipenser ruthenus]|uniref:DDB1-and CUL4-associated factor 11 n=1 Tax=Acipenser ruthenus TaxID=7906 RepID=A0A444V4C6_ACIRT|nr:DDB1- and CUL4-associated factor 11 [Acipenser ruthenus]